MMNFIKFLFYKELQKRNKKHYNKILKLGLPDDMWLTKWIITLFTGYFPKIFTLRIFDFLVVEDFMGPVYVLLTIVLLSKKFLFNDFELTIEYIQNGTKLMSKIDFTKFIKTMQKLEITNKVKKQYLEEYNNSLNSEKKNEFKEFYERLSNYVNKKIVQEKICKNKLFFN